MLAVRAVELEALERPNSFVVDLPTIPNPTLMTRTAIRLAPHAAFMLLSAVVLALAWNIHNQLLPPSGLSSVWFYSGLALLLFSMFYVEPYYQAPRNVMTHALAVILVLLSLRHDLAGIASATPWWQGLLSYAIVVLVISWLAGNIGSEEDAPDSWTNRAASLLKNISVIGGEARVLYSMVFLLFLLLFHQVTDWPVRLALIFWWFLVMTNPQRRIAAAVADLKLQGKEVGQIIAVQARCVFLARTHPNGPVIAPLESVEFSYATDRDPKPIKQGLVLNTYFLENQKWLRILQLEERAGKVQKARAVYRVPPADGTKFAELTDRFLGVVVEHSDIGLIKFELVPGAPKVKEGDVVEVGVGSDHVLYQVVNGRTGREVLESKNEGGYITVDAVQLGRWNATSCGFERFGWVPEMNAAVLKPLWDGEQGNPDGAYVLGRVPSTELSVFMDIEAAVSHHLAILGITGAGKSYITFEIIERLLQSTKVIAVDFTGEYVQKLARLNPTHMIDQEGLDRTEELLAERADAGGKKAQLELRKRIEEKLDGYVARFIESDDRLSLFELPDVSNTTFILEFTQLFLDAIFRYAKRVPGQRICIVVEEAHTVVPETTSLGDFGDYSSNKALVNKIGQIALQGRKYGVGFIIVAQRTANVSKTVLTQCNSMICFQAFDDTSFRFVENHLGRNMVDALPRLPKYHAIVVGKAFRGDVPLIVDLTRQDVTPAPASTGNLTPPQAAAAEADSEPRTF